MRLNKVKLTNLEKEVLNTIIITSINYTGGEFTSFDEVVSNSTLNENSIKGVIGSLVKKEIIIIDSEYMHQISPEWIDDEEVDFNNEYYKELIKEV